MVGDWSNILHLDRLLNLCKGIATSSPQCNECSNLKKQITEAVNDLSNWPHIIYEQQKDYESTLKIVSKHLEKTHGLAVIDKGRNILIAIALAVIILILVAIIYVVGNLKSFL